MNHLIDIKDVINNYEQADFHTLYKNLQLNILGYEENEFIYPLEGEWIKRTQIKYMILRYIKGDKESSPRHRVYFVYMEDGNWGEMILIPEAAEPYPGQSFEYKITAHNFNGVLIPRLTIKGQNTIKKQAHALNYEISKIGYPKCEAGFKVKIVHELWKKEIENGGTFEKVNPYIIKAGKIWNSRNTNTLNDSERVLLKG